VYAALFGTGSFLYGRNAQALVWLVVFVVSGAGLVRLLPRLWGQGPIGANPDPMARGTGAAER